jgi:disulfide bond formation protein DsbB
MSFFPTVSLVLGGLSLLAYAGALALIATLSFAGGRERLGEALDGHERHPMGWAWGVSLVAMAGSLYLSDVVGFVPCLLCWYQRIAMYPLVLVLGVGLVRGDTGVWRYGLPLPMVGALIAGYHVALQMNPSLELIPCTTGAPCTARYLAVFGFVSIPVMAGGAFLLIGALLLLLRTLEARAAARGVAEPGVQA